ncbi:hypothetical protein GCM10028772_01730 [Nocardioides ultimimeridianus]
MVPAPRNVQAGREAGPTRRCDNPDCDTRMEWPGGRGRPPAYCSDVCRQRTVDGARKLRELIRAMELEVDRSEVTYRQRRATSSELSRLRWLLSAYPASVQEPSR